MTVFGKILVVVNLLVSLAVGAMIIVVYTTRTDWAKAYKQLEARSKAADATVVVYAQDAKDTNVDAGAKVADLDKKIKELQGLLTAETAKIVPLKADTDRLNKALTDQQDTVARLQTEIGKHEKEVTVLKEAITKRDLENDDLSKQYTTARQDAINYKSERDSVKLRNQELVVKLEGMEREAKGKTALAGGPNPPPENVEGVIKDVDTRQGLVALTIGSDSGLQKGHTLEVWRPNLNAPEQSKYLGTIRITDVRAKEAVAKPERTQGPLQVGDRVAAKIGG